MKIAKSAEIPGGQSKHLSLDLVMNHKDMTYREVDPEFVKSLSASIEENGLDIPLLVWNGGGDDKRMSVGGQEHPATYLVAGSHRRAALKQLRQRNADRFKELFPAGIPAIVFGGTLTDAMCQQLRENVGRLDMPAEQVLPVVKKLIKEQGLKQNQVAERVGRSPAWVCSILAIEEELGEENVAELKKAGATTKAALAAVKEVKDARRAGKPIDAKQVVSKVVARASALKAQGKTKEDKRVSAKKVWTIYKAMPRMNVGAKLLIAEKALEYLSGDSDKLPKELRMDADDDKKASTKEPAKAAAKPVTKPVAKPVAKK